MPKISLTSKQRLFLSEAFRRNNMGHQLHKPLGERWLGLGTEAQYRPVLRDGLMVFFDGKTPPKRCMGWLVLTDKGITAMIDNAEQLCCQRTGG